MFDLNNKAAINCNPQACQNVIYGNLNIVGINQFHRTINGPPNNIQAKINKPIRNNIS
jgi:hypothetical protein